MHVMGWVAAVLLAVAALRDVAVRTVPNVVCAGLATVALLVHGWSGDLPGALGAGSAVFVLALACWLRGWLGGGDVKLLAAAALLLPPGRVPGFLLVVALAGGALAGCYLLLSVAMPAPHGKPPRQWLRRVARTERWRIAGRRSLPYACAIAAGAFITLLNG